MGLGVTSDDHASLTQHLGCRLSHCADDCTGNFKPIIANVPTRHRGHYATLHLSWFAVARWKEEKIIYCASH
jgi:predicted lipoprotein with Yx(FWY)xxD motif